MSWSDEQGRHEGHIACVFADGLTGSGWSDGGITVSSGPDGQMLDAGEWESRPPSEVVGWRVQCECIPARVTEEDLRHELGFWGKRERWQGPDWHRVADPALEDLDQRRVFAATDDIAAFIDDGRPAVSELIREAWRAHAAGDAGLVDLREAWQRARAAAHEVDQAVATARVAGRSWAEIGAATYMSRQSAHERWRHLEQGREEPA
jgi:hypothetical protein